MTDYEEMECMREYYEQQHENLQMTKVMACDKFWLMSEYLDDLVCEEGETDNMTEIESDFYYMLTEDYGFDEIVGAIVHSFEDYGLMVSQEVKDYNLAKRLESMFEECSEELDNKRIKILESLQPKIENLTKFELMLLEIYGEQKFDDDAEKMLAEDKKECIVCSVRELFV